MPTEARRRDRLLLDGTGTAGLIAIAALVWRTNQYSPFLYRGGLLLLSVATAAVVLAVVSPAGRLGRLLGWPAASVAGRPVLWHLPLALSDHRAHHPGQRHRDPGPGHTPDRRQHRRRGSVLAPDRRADQARRNRAVGCRTLGGLAWFPPSLGDAEHRVPGPGAGDLGARGGSASGIRGGACLGDRQIALRRVGSGPSRPARKRL